MRYKVLFIVNSLAFGGAEKHVVTLLNQLDASAADRSLAYLQDDTTLLPQIDRSRVPDVFLCPVRKKADWNAARQLARYIDEHAIDLVVCTNLSPLLYGWMASRFSRRKPRLVEIFHSSALSTRAERLKMTLFKPLFRAVDLLVYVCENQRTYWSGKGLRARAERVVHNGIDVEHFRDRYSDDEKAALRSRYDLAGNDHVVGICANMRPEKAHSDLIDALAQLKARGIRIVALLIGDGIERERLERRIAALDLAERVRITGFADDVRPLLSICNIVAITSHTETFSIAALEAMALGKPMIMTDVGGAAEQIAPGVNGYLYPAGDISALANALEDSLQPRKCSTLGDNARAIVVERFSLPGMLRTFDDVFRGLVRHRA